MLESLILGAALLLGVIGTVVMLIAGIGVVRMPDLPTRMHASSKAGTLGAILILTAVALGLGGTEVILRVALIVIFLFLTAPLAAHAIARAAYGLGVPLSKRTVVDHLARDRDVIDGSDQDRG